MCLEDLTVLVLHHGRPRAVENPRRTGAQRRSVLAALDAVAAGLSTSIVNLSSVSAYSASPGIAFYGVSKAAVVNLTIQLANELGPNLRVNAVAPAVIKTAFARSLYEGREEQVAAQYVLKRLGEPSDVAGPVAFLLSEDASWMSGQTLIIDGGGRSRAAN